MFRIKRLSNEERKLDAINHLTGLDNYDRYLRFSGSISDSSIERYVNNFDYSNDGIFVVLDDNTDALLGLCHVVIINDSTAEIGISVDARYRDVGLGTSLFNRGIVFARNRKVKTLFLYCMKDNSTMKRIAKKYSFHLKPDFSQIEAVLQLKNPNETTYAYEEYEEDHRHWLFFDL